MTDQEPVDTPASPEPTYTLSNLGLSKEKAKAFASQLSALLEQMSVKEWRRTDQEDDVQYVGRVLPSITRSITGQKKLTSFEAELYNMPKNALNDLYEELGFEEDEVKEFKELEKSEQVSRLNEAYAENPTTTWKNFYKRIYAAQSTVQQYKIDPTPTAAQTKEILNRVLGRDIFKGESPSKLGSRYDFTNGTILNPKTCTYCISLARSKKPQEYLTREYVITEAVAQQSAYILIFPSSNIAEVRATVGDAKQVIDCLFDTLRVNGHKCVPEIRTIDDKDVAFLKEKLDAGLLSQKHTNKDSLAGASRAVLIEADSRSKDASGKVDLTNDQFYKDLKKLFKDTKNAEFESHESYFMFQYAGERHVMRVNTQKHSIRFPEGKADDEVIQKVTGLLNFHRLEREKSGEFKVDKKVNGKTDAKDKPKDGARSVNK